MTLQENMAASIRTVMKLKDKSLSEFSAELGVSRNTLYNYLHGKGNPSIATLEHMAGNLGVDPVAFLLGLAEPDRWELIMLLLNMVQGVSKMSCENRVRFAQLFLEMVELMNETS